MNGCESYELHISALLDGEAEPGDTLAVLDHLPTCDACQEFYRQARELQGLVDAQPFVAETLAIESQSKIVEVSNWWRRTPAWVQPIAAAVLLMVGFWSHALLTAGETSPRLHTYPSTIDLASVERPAMMTEERFVDIAVDLLRSEARYQRKMLQVLTEVRGERPGLGDESPTSVGFEMARTESSDEIENVTSDVPENTAR